MSNLANKLLSRSRLLKTAVLGVVLVASVAAHATAGDVPAAPSHVGDSVAQAQPFDALVGFTAVPLSVAEAETLDAERFKWRLPKRWPLPKPRPCAPGGRLPSICI